MGYTLNSITMLALTLMVGIVIDDAIVVLENIYRFVEEKGMPPFQAAIEGTKEIGLAVLATTLSLLAVFVPIGFMQGIVGRFMSSFGLTASFAVLVSLLVSFTLTPMLAARLLKRKSKGVGHISVAPDETSKIEEEETASSKDNFIYAKVDQAYAAMLRFSMAHRWFIVTLCIIVFISTVPLFIFVGKNFLPVDDQSQFEVSIRAPEGYSLDASGQVFERIASDIRKLPGVTDTLVTIGGGQIPVVNNGTIYVKLSDIKKRDKSQEELMSDTRELLNKYPKDLRTGVQQVQAFSGGGFRNANVQFLISGPDLKDLEKYSSAILEKMRNIPDAVDIDSTLISGKPEIQLEIDRKKAADLGVRIGDISQALNLLVAGQQVSTFNDGGDQFEVHVRAQNKFRADQESLKRLVVPSSKLGTVSLDQLVVYQAGTGPSSIERVNRKRQVTLLANTRPGGSATSIQAGIEKAVKEANLPVGYSTGYVGQSKELGKAGYYFMVAFLLSFVFMYIVLAAQFESFIHPVTILLTLPLAVPFGIVSLLIMGQTVNIFSGLGLLLLFGVVKKNAILQIDHTNHLRSEGMNRYDAIIQANRDRLRPILMTTISLVAGMIPLVVATGAGSGTNRSIGVLVVGGQTLCLLLTLLAVPVFYSIFDDLSELHIFRKIGYLSGRLFGGIRKGFATVTGSMLGK
jgi:HAE1 family hydrophobic/amphiphilic exporter-1